MSEKSKDNTDGGFCKPYIHSFRRFRDGRVFLTNDIGGSVWLSGKEFVKYSGGRLPSAGKLADKLAFECFAANKMDINYAKEQLGERFFRSWRAPHVHIISLSAQCNLSCVYCSASACRESKKVMTEETALKVLYFIFGLDTPRVLIELQGGEPLLQFDLLKFIVSEAGKRAGAKELHFSVVTNLWAMDEKKAEYLTENGITVCASLDGPADLHDANRPCADGSSHERAFKWLKKIAGTCRKERQEPPNAICTVTRKSLAYPKQIIDEYIRAGIKRIQLGPLDPLGRAAKAWKDIGYEAEDFLKFYKEAIEYILELNRHGKPVYEKAALAFAKQLFGLARPRYQNLDLIYRLAYNWDGGIYGSDEARMLANDGDDFFRLGDVRKDDFAAIAGRPVSRFLISSALGCYNQPLCARCPFSLYCRIPPVYNYITQGSPLGNMATNDRCILYKSIYALLSQLSSDKENYKIFRKWDRMYD